MRKIMIVKLEGGLGNQLFQFFAAQKIASDNNLLLILDVTYFNFPNMKSHEKSYILNYPNIKNNFKCISKFPRLVRKVWIILPFISKIGLISYTNDAKRTFEYKKRFNFMKGYFHDKIYLPPKESILYYTILHKYTAADKIEMANAKKNSVMIHVRRGDYLHQANIYQVLTNNYYKNALEILEFEIGVGIEDFWLMSDDPVGAKEWLDIDEKNPKVFDEQQLYDPNTTLEVVSNFNFLIIANSTFSWWAGYLGTLKNPKNVVFYPDRFNNLEKSDARETLGMENWICLNGEGLKIQTLTDSKISKNKFEDDGKLQGKLRKKDSW